MAGVFKNDPQKIELKQRDLHELYFHFDDAQRSLLKKSRFTKRYLEETKIVKHKNRNTLFHLLAVFSSIMLHPFTP